MAGQPESVDVAIIGGGITGCSTARELAQRGRRVVVLERERVGIGASGRNSGYVRITGRHFAEVPLILDAIRLWTDLALQPGVSFGYVRAGFLWIATNEEEMAWLVDKADSEMREFGVRFTQVMTREQVRRMVPGLADVTVGGIFGPMDGHLEPLLATQAMARSARAAGAEIREGVTVLGIERQGGAVCGVETSEGFIRAGAVLLSACVWSPGLAQAVGRELAITNRRSQVQQTAPLPRISDLAVIAPMPGGSHIAFRQLRGGSVTLAGTVRPEFVGFDMSTTEETLRRSRETAERILPCLAGATTEATWAGLNDITPDEIPLLGPDPRVPGLFIAAGFSGHGMGIGPATGRLMAELIAEGKSSYDVEPFRVDRFDHLDIPAELERFRREHKGSMAIRVSGVEAGAKH